MSRERLASVRPDWRRVQLFTSIHFICLLAFAIFAKACIAGMIAVRMAFYLNPAPTGWGTVALFLGEMNRALVPLVGEVQRAVADHSGYTVAIFVGVWTILTLSNAQLLKVVQQRKARRFIRQMSIEDRERFESIRGLGRDPLAAN